MVVEEFIDGREIHATVLGNGRHVICLPLVELKFKGEFKQNWEIYTYEAKWVEESWEFWAVPVKLAVLPARLEKRIEAMAVKAYRQLGCRDIARFDIRVDERDRLYIVDVNFNPSLRRDELDATWVAAKALDWSHGELIENVVAIAYKRVYGKLPDRVRERQYLLAAPS
jgi:D-alanine-D-alanine ligase